MNNFLRFVSTIAFVSSFSTISIAQDIEQLAQIFGKLPEISDAEISPDGTKIALLQNYQGNKILVTKSLVDPSVPQNGIPYPGGEIEWVKWKDNNRIIVGVRFEQKVDMADVSWAIYNVELTMTRMISMDWDGENSFNPIPLVNRRVQPQFQSSVVDFLDNDPDHILIQMDVDEMNERGVQKINIRKKSKKFQKILRGRKIIQYWKADKDHVVRFGYGTSNNRRQLKVRDVAYYRKSESGVWFKLYDVDLNKEDRPFDFVAFTDNPAVIYILKDDKNGKRAVFTFNVDSQETINKIAGNNEIEIENVRLDEFGQPDRYLFNSVRPGYIHLSEDGQRLDNIFKNSFPNTYVAVYSKSKDKTKVIFKVSSPIEPGTFYLLDLNTNKIEMLGYNYQKADIEKLSDMLPINYTAQDGLEIPGYLSLPKGSEAKNLPTIIMPHWGPAFRDRWRFDYITQFLTAQGYAVLQMNYRGSTGYGKEFSDLGKHQWGNKMLADINDGAKWMISEGYADPDNICIVGDTYGGYAALQSIVKEQNLYKCSVAHAAITDLVTYRETRKNYTNFREHMNYIESDDYTLDNASPANNIDKINIPVLLMHAKSDVRVKVRQSEGFYSKMKSAGKEIEFVKWEEGNNYLSGEIQRVDFLRQMGLFLKKHLK